MPKNTNRNEKIEKIFSYNDGEFDSCSQFYQHLKSNFLPLFLCQKSIKPNFKYKKSAFITFIWKSCSLNVSEFKTWTIPISVGRSSCICQKCFSWVFLDKSWWIKLKIMRIGFKISTYFLENFQSRKLDYLWTIGFYSHNCFIENKIKKSLKGFVMLSLPKNTIYQLYFNSLTFE